MDKTVVEDEVTTSEQPFLFGDGWIEVKDGDPTVKSIFDRHYSRRHYRDNRTPALFVGPGEKMVLMTANAKAIFIWRKFISDDGQNGVNCAVFRKEMSGKASEMILAAEEMAWKRWPGERLYTYVDGKKVKSSNPGCCFKKAGWKQCGITKHKRLLIFEKWPEVMNAENEKFRKLAGRKDV